MTTEAFWWKLDSISGLNIIIDTASGRSGRNLGATLTTGCGPFGNCLTGAAYYRFVSWSVSDYYDFDPSDDLPNSWSVSAWILISLSGERYFIGAQSGGTFEFDEKFINVLDTVQPIKDSEKESHKNWRQIGYVE